MIEWITCIAEIVIIILALISIFLVRRIYHKLPTGLLSCAFCSVIAIWILRAIMRFLQGGVFLLDRWPIWLWSIVGLIEVSIIVYLILNLVRIMEKYL